MAQGGGELGGTQAGQETRRRTDSRREDKLYE